jgi:AcrR family transcriptional regulator
MAEPLSRRSRIRADTVHEIKQTARLVVVDQGVHGLTLRAVAREMGVTAPALYRYFTSRDELVEHVVADLYLELCDVLEGVRKAVTPATPGAQLLAVSRAFRLWVTTHHAEFGLLFGRAGERVPSSGAGEGGDRPSEVAAQRFTRVFVALVCDIYREQGFPVPADDAIDPALRTQLRNWREKLSLSLPLGAMSISLRCWIRLYGMVCMEVFGHLRFALEDAESVFESELRALGDVLGIAGEYRPPAG